MATDHQYRALMLPIASRFDRNLHQLILSPKKEGAPGEKRTFESTTAESLINPERQEVVAVATTQQESGHVTGFV